MFLQLIPPSSRRCNAISDFVVSADITPLASRTIRLRQLARLVVTRSARSARLRDLLRLPFDLEAHLGHFPSSSAISAHY